MKEFLSPVSLSSAALGLASIGILYALHHLKQRIQRRSVATLLFWSHALRPQQSRVLSSRRFAHPGTFLLLATILLSLTVPMTADRWRASDHLPVDVIVIDTGMETATPDSSGQTLLQKMTVSASLDLARAASGPAVISAGPHPVLIAREDEAIALASRCLAGLSPQAGASASPLALLMADGVVADNSGRIDWYTPKGEIPVGLPDRAAGRIVIHSIRAHDEAVIGGVVFEPIPSDAARGQLRVRVLSNTTNDQASMLIVQNQTETSVQLPAAPFGYEKTVIVDNIVADGRSVTLALRNAAGVVATPPVTLTLPDRRPLAFRFADNVPSSLKLALLANGIEADDATAAANIFVTESDEAIPPGMKGMVSVVSGGGGIPAGASLELAELPITRGINLEQATAIDGPALSDGVPLIFAAHAVAAAMDRSATPPTLRISRALLGPTADLPKHAAFPLLIGRFCDALADHAADLALVSQSRAAIDPLWRGPSDVPSMILMPVPDRPVNPVDPSVASSIPFHPRSIRWANAVLIAALGLLVVDSLLRITKKIV